MTKSNSPTVETPWFCFDGDDYEYFSTEEEAIEASKSAIQFYLDETWDECVENVQVGKVTGIARKINIEQRPDDEELDEEGCDGQGGYWPDEIAYKCDYKVLSLGIDESSESVEIAAEDRVRAGLVKALGKPENCDSDLADLLVEVQFLREGKAEA
ncbi:hypothetical protein MYC06_004732 [Vibrio parahaemolyticus]|nr:hypothetical protein [Vibrio parahaemolyticus]EJC7066898.1 hypothetical protein [Vibrio parahaemolyticus]